MNQNEEYFKALYDYQVKMYELQKRESRRVLRIACIGIGMCIAFVGLLMFFFLPDFWPWNQ